jgi:Spy/CpxP family protein refolding chaperone
MARHIAWVFAAALVSAAPASAAVCERTARADQQKPAQPAQPGSAAGKDAKDPRAEAGQDRRPWKFWQGKSQAELGITTQQSAEIEQIFQSTFPMLETTTQKIHKLEATLSQTIKDNVADLATVSQQVDRLAEARSELYKTRTLMLYRMHHVLSADQRTKLQAMVDRWNESERKKTTTDSTGRR